jgi:hypothetical protein
MSYFIVFLIKQTTVVLEFGNIIMLPHHFFGLKGVDGFIFYWFSFRSTYIFFCYRLPFTEGDENSFPSSLLVLNLKKILILLKKNHGFDLKLLLLLLLLLLLWLILLLLLFIIITIIINKKNKNIITKKNNKFDLNGLKIIRT